jgi:phosphoadenosine phosphosulfate reductase
MCTLPVQSGEDSRKGRWANAGKTECGLHTIDNVDRENEVAEKVAGK